MPDPNDSVVEAEFTGDSANPGDPAMADQLAEPGNLAVAMTILSNGAAAGSNRRTDAADQLASDSQRMWSIAMTSPTVMAAHGMRVATEAGSGRTRAETNAPDNTAAQRAT
jgi:hypothetical protein